MGPQGADSACPFWAITCERNVLLSCQSPDSGLFAQQLYGLLSSYLRYLWQWLPTFSQSLTPTDDGKAWREGAELACEDVCHV